MAKVKLYNKDTTTFIGDLNDTIKCNVTEERNGQFELTMQYPNQKQLSNMLIEGNVIQCNANDELLNQKFRIYKTRKLMSNKIEIMARHISFDLMYDFIESISIINQPCNYVLNEIFRRSNFSQHYQGFSDIVNAQNYNMELSNCLEAIGGKQGSVLDTFGTGAEILRDNTNIHVLNKRGHDNGVHITYSKNMTDITVEEDRTDMITRIYAYAKGKDSSGGEIIITAPNKYVDSPKINLYDHPYIKHIDFTDKFGQDETPTSERIQYFAEKYYRDNNPDIPKINYKISFIPLSKTTQGGPTDNIKLCDIVYVDDTRYNIQTQAKAIKTVFNVLLNRYDAIELGQPKSTLANLVGQGGQEGPAGPPGPQGPPGADGEVGDFPDSLPNVPQLTLTLLGLESIQCDWTFENKVYYHYQLYASKIKDFIPTAFDLIHEGQTSSFLFAAKPDETWYFRVRAGNTHNRWTEFSSQMSISTVKIDASTFIKEATIGNALIGNISADKINAGKLFGQYIDARNLSVTDGNQKRTLDIDSFGNVNLDVTNLNIRGNDISDIYANKTELTQTANELELKASSIQNNMLNNSNGFDDKAWWGISSSSMTVRTPVTNPEIKKGFHFVNAGGDLGVRFSQELNLQGGKTYTFQLNCTDIQVNVLNGYRVTVQDNSDGSYVYDSGPIKSLGIRRFKYKPAKTGSFKLGIWHNGASQVNGSVIAFEDFLFVEGDFNNKLTWVDNSNDAASISIKANQIVNKVSASDVASIIEQNPGSVEVSFNKINPNVTNDNSAFRVRNGAIEVYNPQGLKCFSVDPDGWLRVWGLKVYGPGNPIQFTGDGDKGIEINANKGNANYIDFSDNGSDQDYICRIIRNANTNYLNFIGGAAIKNSPTNPTSRLEMRSDVGGDAYIDFSHNSTEDNQARIYHKNGENMLRIQTSGLWIEGNGGRLYTNIIGRSTGIGTMSIYFTDNIDMGGRVIYNSNIVNPSMSMSYSLNNSSPGNSVGADSISIENILLEEEYSKYDEETNSVDVDFNKAFIKTYEDKVNLEKENYKIKYKNSELLKEIARKDKEIQDIKDNIAMLALEVARIKGGN